MTLLGKDIISSLRALLRIGRRSGGQSGGERPAGKSTGKLNTKFIHSIHALEQARPGDRLIIGGDLIFTLLDEGNAKPPNERFIAQPDRPASPSRWRPGTTKDKTKIKVWANRALFRGPVPMHRLEAYSVLDYYTAWAMAQKRGLIAIGGYSPEEDQDVEDVTILYVLAVHKSGTVLSLDEQSLPSQLHQEDYFYSELSLLLDELRQNYPEHALAWLAPLRPCPEDQRAEYIRRFPAGFEYVGDGLFDKIRPAHRILDPAHVSFSERYGLSFAIVIIALIIPIVPYWQLWMDFATEQASFQSARQALKTHIRNQPGPARANPVPMHPDIVKYRKAYLERTVEQSQRLAFLFHFLGRIAEIEEAIVREVKIPLRFEPAKPTVYLGDDPNLKYDPERVIRMDIALPSEKGKALEQGEALLEKLHARTRMTLFIPPDGWAEEKINEHDYRRYTVVVPF